MAFRPPARPQALATLPLPSTLQPVDAPHSLLDITTNNLARRRIIPPATALPQELHDRLTNRQTVPDIFEAIAADDASAYLRYLTPLIQYARFTLPPAGAQQLTPQLTQDIITALWRERPRNILKYHLNAPYTDAAAGPLTDAAFDIAVTYGYNSLLHAALTQATLNTTTSRRRGRDMVYDASGASTNFVVAAIRQDRWEYVEYFVQNFRMPFMGLTARYIFDTAVKNTGDNRQRILHLLASAYIHQHGIDAFNDDFADNAVVLAAAQDIDEDTRE